MQKLGAVWRSFPDIKQRAYASVAKEMNELSISSMLITIHNFLSQMFVGDI